MVTDLSAFNAGGQHVIVQLRFEDGVVWLARIRFPPCIIARHQCVGGFKACQNAAVSMECEIATMKYVEDNISLPVYTHNLSQDHCLGAPYIMIEEMPGQ
jgi:hypothetical protein